MKQNGFHFPTTRQAATGWPPLGVEASSAAPRGWLGLWYRWTAPPEPPPTANFRRHEVVRRGRLTSLIVLILLVVTLFSLPMAFMQKNYALGMTFCLWLIADVVVLFLNKSGRVLMAGVITVGTAMIIYALIQILMRERLGLEDLQNFDLLVQAELLAVSLLPARSVFIVAGLNSLFIWTDITLQQHAPDLSHALAIHSYTLIERPILLQIAIALVAYFWMRSATQAIARADRAEVVAALQRAMAQREYDLVEQSRALDASIAQIVQTHRLVGAGDFHARVHLSSGDLLSPIADSLNNLLLRFQRLLAESDELVRTKVQAAQVMSALREASITGMPVRLPEKGIGTCVDLLILELAAYMQQLCLPQTKQRDKALPRSVEKAAQIEKPRSVPDTLPKNSRVFPVIEAIDLYKVKNETPIIDHASLEVLAGEILGILAAKPSEKTALFDLLCGRDTPSGGSIKMLGNDLRSHKKQLQHILGVVPAPPYDFDTLDKRYTVEEYLRFQREPVEDTQQHFERIATVLTQAGLLRYRNLLVQSLPIDMRRCLAIARALLYNPVLLIINDPTGGIQEQDRKTLWSFLQSIRDEGRTLVLLASSQEEITSLCDRSVVLEHGKIRDVSP